MRATIVPRARCAGGGSRATKHPPRRIGFFTQHSTLETASIALFNIGSKIRTLYASVATQWYIAVEIVDQFGAIEILRLRASSPPCVGDVIL